MQKPNGLAAAPDAPETAALVQTNRSGNHSHNRSVTPVFGPNNLGEYSSSEH